MPMRGRRRCCSKMIRRRAAGDWRRYLKRMRQRSDLSVEGAATAEGIPVAPDMTEPRVPIERAFIDKRVVLLCFWSVVLAVATGFIAQGLVGLIGIVTNIAFYGRFSTSFV